MQSWAIGGIFIALVCEDSSPTAWSDLQVQSGQQFHVGTAQRGPNPQNSNSYRQLPQSETLQRGPGAQSGASFSQMQPSVQTGGERQFQQAGGQHVVYAPVAQRASPGYGDFAGQKRKPDGDQVLVCLHMILPLNEQTAMSFFSSPLQDKRRIKDRAALHPFQETGKA